MAVKVVRLEDQAIGQFNGGAILENKPIGFPQDGGSLKPYSNLFYWAHAWTPGDKSLIGEHGHQGFEIMSFVLKGSIVHYDDKNKDWRKLNEGDAQIIRSGNGIRHAEMVNQNSEFFQIWIDPNLRETLDFEPSYDDYTSDRFPVVRENGRSTKIYKGEGSPLNMHSKGVEIMHHKFEPGDHVLSLDQVKVHSIYLLEGIVNVNDEALETKDYVIVNDHDQISLNSEKVFTLFIVSTPEKLDYRTYAEQIRY